MDVVARARTGRPFRSRRAPRLALGVVLSGLLAAGAIAVSAAGAQAATPGSVDTTFGANGSTTTDVTSVLGPFTSIGGAVQQPNGDIVVSDGQGLLRLLPTGQLDASFGARGFGTAPNVASATSTATTPTLSLQPDGKIIWAGAGKSPAGGSDWELARFNANGTLDASFGTAGVATTEFFPMPAAADLEVPGAVLVQPDGKILVSGEIAQHRTGGLSLFGNAVVRYNPGGTLDAGFGTGGKVPTGSLGPGVPVVSSGLAFGDGELGLDAAGDIFVVAGSTVNTVALFPPAEAELGPSGQLAASAAGVPITASSGPALLGNGNFEQASAFGDGRHDPDLKVDLFTAGGSLASASAPLDFAGIPAGALPGGQTLVAGGPSGGVATPGLGPELLAVNADGTVDANFGSNGVASSPLPANEAVTAPIATLPEAGGKILVVSKTTNSINADLQITLTRFNL